MKTLSRLTFAFAILVSAIILASCEKKSSSDTGATGTARFSFSLGPGGTSKSGGADSLNATYQLMISVEDLQGNAVLTDKMVPVYAFGTGFMSDKIAIKAGDYKLTKFLVIDPAGYVLYASPLEGSPLAYIAKDPLPVIFSVVPGQVTSVEPEVILVGNYSPGDFGYASFGVTIIKPLEFFAIAYLDNPLLMAPTQITEAKLTVIAADGWSYTFDLKAQVNDLIIRGGSDTYTFVVAKDGYQTQTYQFSSWELLNTSKESPLGLKIPWGPQYKTLEIQPGPEAGKDAMISNLEPEKNFGDYKYFEATFLTEPVLTVMRSNRSLIAFSLDSLPKSAIIRKVMLQLSYDLPIPVDSTVIYTDPNTGVSAYAAVLQQVIEPWDEHKVTWSNQPKTIEMNQVFLYPFVKNSNIIELDVTSLFVNPSASVLPNYGMLFRLWPNDSFPGFRFVSSDYPVAAMRPKLIVSFSE